MPRDASQVFYWSPGNEAVPDTPVRAAQFNGTRADIAQECNTPRPVVQGGTGASSPGAALANLGAQKALTTQGNVTIGSERTDGGGSASLNLSVFPGELFNARFYRHEGASSGELQLIQTGSGDIDIKGGGKLKRDGAVVPNSAYGDPGSLGFLRSTVAVAQGATVAAVNLAAAGITSTGALNVSASALNGTWRALGNCPANGATLFVRVS